MSNQTYYADLVCVHEDDLRRFEEDIGYQTNDIYYKIEEYAWKLKVKNGCVTSAKKASGMSSILQTNRIPDGRFYILDYTSYIKLYVLFPDLCSDYRRITPNNYIVLKNSKLVWQQEYGYSIQYAEGNTVYNSKRSISAYRFVGGKTRDQWGQYAKVIASKKKQMFVNKAADILIKSQLEYRDSVVRSLTAKSMPANALLQFNASKLFLYKDVLKCILEFLTPVELFYLVVDGKMDPRVVEWLIDYSITGPDGYDQYGSFNNKIPMTAEQLSVSEIALYKYESHDCNSCRYDYARCICYDCEMCGARNQRHSCQCYFREDDY